MWTAARPWSRIILKTKPDIVIPPPYSTRSFPPPAVRNTIDNAARHLPGGIFDFLLISTPQSIAKPSPGWNKVALLTAVRNSPCSCPFSVSLHPPQAALNSEPRCIAHWARSARIPRTRWRLLVRFTNLYINNNGDASRPLIFTISYAHPPQGGSHIVQAIFHCALAQFHPFARTDFTAGVSPLTSPFLPGQRSGSRRPPRCRW